MLIPELGPVSEPDDLGWRHSEPTVAAVLRGNECCLVLDGYDDDPDKEDFHTTIKNFLHAAGAAR